MTIQEYPEGDWPQQPYSLSDEMSGQVVSGDVHGAGLAQFEMQMHSAGLSEQTGFGASSESCRVRVWQARSMDLT